MIVIDVYKRQQLILLKVQPVERLIALRAQFFAQRQQALCGIARHLALECDAALGGVGDLFGHRFDVYVYHACQRLGKRLGILDLARAGRYGVCGCAHCQHRAVAVDYLAAARAHARLAGPLALRALLQVIRDYQLQVNKLPHQHAEYNAERTH